MNLSKNDFIRKCGTGYGLVGQFKRFGSLPKLVEDADGKNVPSPHMAIKQFVGKLAKSDWAAWTEGTGRNKVACILFVDKKDLVNFQKFFSLAPLPASDYKPFRSAHRFVVIPQAYYKLALALGYSAPFSRKIGNRRVRVRL